MKTGFWQRPETLFALFCLCLGALGYVFLGSLVAPPKVLLGRSLTAIPPSLFPSIVLSLLFVLCAIQLVISFRAASASDEVDRIVGWRRGAVFFGIMTVYALVMVHLGFIISSALAIAALSLYIGNRSIVQIVLVAVIAPILLYLAATRLLAVSLPELNAIQLAIAQVFELFQGSSSTIEQEIAQ